MSAPTAALYLKIPGEPVAWARAGRTAKGISFTPKRQVAYASRVGDAWRDKGQPRLQAGAFRIHVVAHLPRPSGHYRVNGELSAAGLRAAWPTKKPDTSNLVKLVEDALVELGAIPDDRFIVRSLVEKRWAPTSADACLEFYATSLVPELEVPPTDGPAAVSAPGARSDHQGGPTP